MMRPSQLLYIALLASLGYVAQAQIDTASLASTTQSDSQGSTANACHGQTFNPASDPDWNNLFPITVLGVSVGGNANPPQMYVPPVCVCPGIFGIPSYGIGVTYWQPMYIAEIEKIAGCASSLGGQKILDGYDGLNSEQGFFLPDKGAAVSTRMQMHWYQYPIFSILDIFKSMICRSESGFNLLYVSEVDSMWQNDTWAGIFNPEASLFANLIAQAACIVDSVAANLAFPVDELFWCAGTWGAVYPLAGTANQSLYPYQLNHLVLAKFLARQARLGLAWRTIGASAICSAHADMFWVKSQYRVDQTYPINRRGSPLVIGAQPIKQNPFMLTNPPGLDSTVSLIWQGQQCCIRSY